MRLTEVTPLHHEQQLSGPHSDRLTQLLIWIAFLLIAALVAVTADLWLWPASNGPVVQAIGPAPLLQTLPPTPLAALPSAISGTDTTATRAETSSALPQPISVEPTAQITPTEPPANEATPARPVTPSSCIPPDDWGIVTVQPGNTLSSFADRYRIDLTTLMDVNCLNTQTIFIGQQLYVPRPPASPTVPTPVATSPPVPTPTRIARPGASATPSEGMSMGSRPPATSTPQSPFRLNIPDHYLNILLLGSDRRPRSGAWRTDSMIVVSVDMQNNVVRLLSIPRDLWVFIPGHGNNRINTADLWGELARKGGGPERVKQTIYHNLGIPIHYYVRVDFQGFVQIINAVGGVNVDVDCPLPDIRLSAGMHHLDGRQALRYARSRKSTNDFDRGRRQRKVLLALWDQALTLDIIPKLPQLWRTMANTFQTDLPLEQVINLAYVGVQLEPQRILSKAIGASHVQSWITPQGAAVLLPREDKIRTMLENYYAPTNLERLDDTGKIRVQVLNGSQRREAEKLAAAALRWEGFKVVDTGPADRRDYAQTRILVYNGDPTAGERLARQLNLPLGAIQNLAGAGEQPDPANAVDIQVILGQDYDPCQR